MLAFGSYEELLESDEIDAVYIPLPTSHHIEWAVKAANAGKHVLCEKPIALRAMDIKKVINARNKNKVIVSEAFMVTYHPQWKKVRDLISRGAIGTLRHIDASFTYFNTDAKNMRNRPELGGGALPDIGVYPTVGARFVTGLEPQRVQALVDYDPKLRVDRYANVQAEFPGFKMTFYVSTQLGNRQSMVFHGDKGFIEMTAPFNSNLYEGDEVRLHNAKQPVFSLEDSMLNQRVIDAIYKAGKSGKWQAV